MKDSMKNIFVMILASVLCILAGCGGGSAPAATTKVAGTASKGIIYPGSVNIYAVDSAGIKSATPLKTVTTETNGQFNADIGVYSGPIIIEVTGTYTDEATAATVAIDPARPMRAAIDAVSATTTRRFAVTPLTDLAYTLAASQLTAANIAAANAHVSSIFKISDIIGIEPVAPNAMNGAGTDKQAYTLALMSISQMARNSNPGATAAFPQIATLLDSFVTDLSASATAGLNSANTAAFASALGSVTTNLLPGFDNAASILSSVGSTTLKLTLTASGLPAGSLIGGVQGKITLPAGTSARVSSIANGEVNSTLFTAKGNAAASLSTSSFIAQVITFGILNGNGFADGDFATLTVDVSTGSPTASDFALGNLKVIDVNGADLNVAITLK